MNACKRRACRAGASTVVLALSSCGNGSALVSWLLDNGPPSEVDAPTLISDVGVGSGPNDPRTSPVEVRFRLSNSQSLPTSIALVYSTPGSIEVPLSLVGTPALTELATAPTGAQYSFQWDFAGQLPTGQALAESIDLTVYLSDLSAAVSYGPFDLGNDPAQVTVLSFPTQETSGVVPVELLVTDSSSDLVALSVEFDDADNPSGWQAATPIGAVLDNLSATPTGIVATFFWDSALDEPSDEFRATLRITADDGTAAGVPVEAGPITVDNNAEPVAFANGSAFFATPDARRGIPVPIRVLDDEDDPVTLVLQWKKPAETFPDLPDSLAEVRQILDDPLLRAEHQIASEVTPRFGGHLIPIGPASARLSELRRGDAPGTRPLLGRTIDLLRPANAFVSAASLWSTIDLVAPVGAIPIDDGRSTLVVDEPSPGSWRLRELDLANGAVLRNVAGGSHGTPFAVGLDTNGANVLVAVGSWSVLRVEIATGATTVLATANGSTEVGPVRGITAWGAERALITVGSSLIVLQEGGGQQALADDLAAPHALFWAPFDDGRLFLAEQDWINPATSAVEGRVLELDLATMTRTSVATQGVSLSRPTAIAPARGGQVLLAVTDEVPADGERELRGVYLAGQEQGTSFQLSTIPDGATAIASGPDALEIVVDAGSGDLVLAGGLQQSRTVLAFDPTLGDVQVDADFDPAPAPNQSWRINDGLLTASPSSFAAAEGFTWDSSDLGTGGDVVLRVVPYDTERGTGSDTGVPRMVRAPLDVSPEILGGPGLTDGAAAIALADLTGDGLIDLASANAGSDTVAVFHQTSTGFSGVPDETVSGIPILVPMTEPVDIVAIDIAADGLFDLVTVDRGGDDLTTIVQGVPGVSITTSSLGLSLSAPESASAGDLDGDGLADLVAASTGSDSLAVFLQTPLGVIPPVESETISAPQLLEPRDVAVGDLDHDGDLDLVCACASSDALLVFAQISPGSFDPTGVAIGGPGFTDGPTGVAVGDVDGDGLLDVVCANEVGNQVSIFLQDTNGLPLLPDLALFSPTGPTAPRHVEILDADADGDADVASIQGVGDVRVYIQDATSRTYSECDLIAGRGDLTLPEAAASADVDGDGRTDLLVANSGGNSIAIFRQARPASFDSATTIGDGSSTPGLTDVALADVDGDGDLDVLAASPDDGAIAIFRQLSPALFLSTPYATIDTGGPTRGTSGVVGGDVNGDGRVDVLALNETAGELLVFHQGATGFPGTPDVIMGGLASPASISLGDLDGDGLDDVACAAAGSDQLAIFLQSSAGSYPAVPDQVVGSSASTVSPRDSAIADLDGDGDLDLASVNYGSNDLAVFLQTGGTLPILPDASLGGAGAIQSPIALTVGDFNGDGQLDLVSANEGSGDVTLFLQTSPGTFSTLPDVFLSDALVSVPSAVESADLDQDGGRDVIAGGDDHLLIYRQLAPATFSAAHAVGGPGLTDGPRSIVAADVDSDGDVDLLSAHPPLQIAKLYFSGH